MFDIGNLRGLFRRRQRVQVPAYPQNLLIEPTNGCNLRCRMCSVWGDEVNRKREVGFIPREIWTAALDEIGSWPAPVTVDLHGAGEPLLHPDFFEILAYAKSKRNVTAGFLCNGTLLDDHRARTVLDTRADWVCFSVDGAQREVFEHYRRGAILSQVEENIERFLSMRKDRSPAVVLNMVFHEEADLDLFINRWAGRVETLMISKKKPVRREDNVPVKLAKPCPLLYQQMVMGWNGTAVLCCEDCWGDYITGSIPQQSLLDIWQGRSLSLARERHERDRHRDITVCRTCDSGVFHVFEEKTVAGGDHKTLVKKELPDINRDVTGT